MNRIGIIGAMEEEVATLKKQLEDIKIERKAGMEFYEGTYAGKQLVVVRSGIGKVNAGICAQILVDDFKIEAVINTGIAGGLNADVEIGDIVISTDAVQHDMDATGFGYEVGQIPQMKESIFKADEKLVEIATSVCKEVNPEINTLTGRVVTGDQFISNKDKKEWLLSTFDGYCAEMEGGAIAQAATLNEIPFVIIRSISDKADNTACDDYPQFEKRAAEHAVNLVNGMVAKM